MPFYEKGDVRIRYEEAGTGFPLLVTPGGGLNSKVSNWPTAVFNAMEAFKNDFHCITMDQRNANGGESTGPVPVDDPWNAFADDQLGLMDHLGIREFFYMGYCIGGCFAGKLLERAPQRVVAAVFCQSVGHRPEDPDVMYRHGHENWAPDFRARRPDVTMETVEKYFHNLYRVRPDFLYSVSRDFIRNCRTPILVLPDDTPAHPLQTSIDVASLAPNAEITVFPWREPPELKERTINRVRSFLKSNVPMASGRPIEDVVSWCNPPSGGDVGGRHCPRLRGALRLVEQKDDNIRDPDTHHGPATAARVSSPRPRRLCGDAGEPGSDALPGHGPHVYPRRSLADDGHVSWAVGAARLWHVGMRQNRRRQICRERRDLPAARLAGAGTLLFARPALLATGVCDRSGDGGTGLVFRALSVKSRCELHSARQPPIEARHRAPRRGM